MSNCPGGRAQRNFVSCLSMAAWCYSFQDLVKELWGHPQMVLEGVDIFGAELSGEKC